MTNRDRVDRGMAYLASGLGPFVDTRMGMAFPTGRDWMKTLVMRNPSRYAAGARYSLADPRFLLRVVTEEWRLFKDQLSRVEHGYATELKDVGNKWAHGEMFSADDTYRTLDTVERLLTAIGAAGLAGDVRSLRLDLQQPTVETATPASVAPATRLAPSVREQRGHSTGFWARVARADVVRAIEEYDRLGQDQFLTEYGFGRATAYLLIYRERSYDSKAILGVAYKFATGVPIGPHDFSGGIYGAAGVLRRLGFEVRNTRDPVAPRLEHADGPERLARTRVPGCRSAPALTNLPPAPSTGLPLSGRSWC